MLGVRTGIPQDIVTFFAGEYGKQHQGMKENAGETELGHLVDGIIRVESDLHEGRIV